MGETRRAYRIIVRKPLGKHLLSKLDETASVWENYTGKAERKGETQPEDGGFGRQNVTDWVDGSGSESLNWR